MQNTLPSGFLLRRPNFDDLKAVVEMVRTTEQAETGRARTTESELRTRWEISGFDLARDAWLVSAPDGSVVAIAELGHSKIEAMRGSPKVHPDYIEAGLYAYLLELLVERARDFIPEAQVEARVTLNSLCFEKNIVAHNSFADAGFTHVRSDWLMQIDMEQAPPEPIWAEGLELRPYTPDMLYAIFEADNEAFLDHWGFIPVAFEIWQTWTIKREPFDPTLWFLVFDGAEIAAIALCGYEDGEAWVGELGVRRPWRRKGLGLALLHQAFGEFYRRNTRRVVLNVDSQNLTGATRLYKRAGMHQVEQYDIYQLELRPGLELATQELSD